LFEFHLFKMVSNTLTLYFHVNDVQIYARKIYLEHWTENPTAAGLNPVRGLFFTILVSWQPLF